MPAAIRSLVNGLNPVVSASRNDARDGDIIQLDHVGAPGTTYAWSLTYTPEDRDRNNSAAVLAGDIFGIGPVTFTIDNQGAYLVCLVVDAGLPTQSIQYVRIRFLTKFGKFSLVAAGERRDGTGIIPVDISPDGWADDQNYNLNHLAAFLQSVSSSGRIIYVDANRGKDNNNPQDDPTIAESFADFSTITAAILAAETDADFNGGIPPSSYQPMVIAIRPGFYQEDVTLKPYIHLIGWPSSGGGVGQNPDHSRVVTVRCANAGGPPAGTHTANLPNAGEYCMVSGIVFENTGATTNALLRKIGLGDVYLLNCELLQTGGGAPNQGAGISVERGRAFLDHCRVVQQDVFTSTSSAFEVTTSVGNTARLIAHQSDFVGTSIGTLDRLQNGGATGLFSDCGFEQIGVDPASVGIQTWSEDVYFDGCTFEIASPGITDAIEANPDLAGTPGDLFLRVRNCVVGTNDNPPTSYFGISVDDTNVVGTASLFLGSSEYGTITTTPGVVVRALTLGTSLYYDDTISGLGVNTVQEAIDLLSGGAAPADATYLTLAVNATLTQERVLTPIGGELVGTDNGPNNTYTLGLATTAVVPGSYQRANITVDANGRVTAAADNLGLMSYSRESAIPIGAVIIPPFNINNFDIINITSFTFAGGGTGPVQIYIDQPLGLAPGSAFVDVLVGAPGLGTSILAAAYDISALPANSLVAPTMGAGPFSFAAGDIITFQVTWNVIPLTGDGLVISLTGVPG